MGVTGDADLDGPGGGRCGRGTTGPGRSPAARPSGSRSAGALVTDPTVILADEPSGNLDRDNAAGVLAALSAAASGAGDVTGGDGGSRRNARTVLIATHDPFVIDSSDEVLAL